MKRIAKLLCVSSALALWATIASATPIFLGTGSGNDKDEQAIEAIINASASYTGTRPVDIHFYAKVDQPAYTSGGLTLTYSGDLKSGTWTAGALIDFITVKGGNQYSVWWINGPASSGTWTTEHLSVGKGNQPAISHLTAWTVKSISIPEPGTMVMLGFGLLGIVFISRRRIIR